MSGRKLFKFAQFSERPEGKTATDNKGPADGAVVEDLEPRILFSADVLGLAVIDSDHTSSNTASLAIPELLNNPTITEDANITRSAEWVFVDSRTPDIDRLLADFVVQQNSGRSLQIEIIGENENGINKITDTLALHSGVSAVHIISHGNEVGITLGDSWIDQNSVENYATKIQQWQHALTTEADLLLYGCHLAASAEGTQLLNNLSNYSGADVAASNDLTGHTFYKGDWNLEYTIGSIETEIALSQTLQDSWANQLAIDLLAVDDDFGEVLSGSTISLNDPVASPETNILANDQTSAPAVQLLDVLEPVVGTIQKTSDAYTYVANPGYTGSDSFDYIITDSTQPIVKHFPLDSASTSDSTTGDATVSVPTPNQPTLNGNDLVFDGDDYIEISDFDYPAQFTLSIDFKVGNITANKIETLYQHGNIASDNSIQVYIDGSYLVVSVSDSTGDIPDIFSPAFDISAYSGTDAWQNITIRHSEHPASGPTGETQIDVFLNGVDQDVYQVGFAGFPPPRGGDPIDPSGNIYLGKYQNPDGSSDYFLDDHQIREVRLYDELVSTNAAKQSIEYSTGTVTLALRDPNQTPVFTSLDGNPLYIEDLPPVVLDHDATITDTELSAADNFNGSTLSLQRSGSTNPDDAFSNSGNLAPLIESQPLIYNDASTGNITLGTVTTNSNGLLLLNFNNNATNELINSVLQSISYSNTNGSPPASVDMDWTFNDGFNGLVEFGSDLTAIGTTTVTIEEIPDITITALDAQIATDEDTPFIFSNRFPIIHDQLPAEPFTVELSVDHGQISISAPPATTVTGNNSNFLVLNGSIDELAQSLQSITYLPDTNYNGIDKLTVAGRFDSYPLLSTGVSTNIVVNSVNDRPVIGNANNTISFNATTSASVPIDTDITINDAELNLSGNYENTSALLSRINATDTANGPVTSANPEDSFSSPIQALNLLEGSDLIDGTVFGHVQKNSDGQLQLIFNSTADKAKIEALLQSIHYESNGAWPPNSSNWPSDKVELQWTFNDNGNDELGITAAEPEAVAVAPSIIDITSPGYPPQKIINQSLLIQTNATAQTIDSTLLKYIDPDSTAAETVFTITNVSGSTGNLQLNGVTIGINDTFTQQDIDQGVLTYTSTSTSPGTATVFFDVQGTALVSVSNSFDIVSINDGPTALQPGVRLNLDGGNDAFLGGTGNTEFIQTTQGLTWEFTFSELSFDTGSTEATIYSISGGNRFVGHYDHLIVKPDGTIEWINQTLVASGAPVVTTFQPGVLDGGVHTIAITMDVTAGGLIKLYYDGQYLDSGTHSLPDPVTYIGDYPWVIGQQLLPTSTLSSPASFDNYDFVPGTHFSGVIHEVRFWNEVRSVTEIQNSSNARIDYQPSLTPALSGNWHMHDPNGDESVNSIQNLAPGRPGQSTISTLIPGHATGTGFTTSYPTDELAIDDTASDGTVVGYLTPKDVVPDLDGYQYSLISNGQPSPFGIEPGTGKVFISDNTLLSESTSHYDLVIRVTSTDASGVTHSEVIDLRVNAINESPAITTSNTAAVNFTEGEAPVTLDSGITVSDNELDASGYAGSTLELERFDPLNNTVSPNLDDVFSSALFSNSNPAYTATQSNGRLLVSFHTGAITSDVNQVLQSIKYENSSDDPPATVQLRWLFNDGNTISQGSGGTLEAQTYTDVQIAPVNDAPTLNILPNPLNVTDEDTMVEINLSSLTPQGQDSDGTISSFQVINQGTGSHLIANTYISAPSATSRINNSTSVFWTPPTNAHGLFEAFQVLAVDNQGGVSETPRSVFIQVNSISDPPEGSDLSIDILEDSRTFLTVADFGFTDIDGDNFSAVSIINVTGGRLEVTGNTFTPPDTIGIAEILIGAVSFVPTADQHSHNASITFSVIDNGVNSTDQTSNTIALNVSPVNDPPASQNIIVPLFEDESASLSTAHFSFIDSIDDHPLNPDGHNAYKITIDTLPSHGILSFNDIPLVAGDEVLYSSLNTNLNYTPAADNHTDTWLDFRVADNGGIINGGQDTALTPYRIEFPITSVNDHPSGADLSLPLLEGSNHTFLSSDFGFTDIQDNNEFLALDIHTLPGDGFLTLSGTTLTSPTQVLKTDIDNGQFIYVSPIHTQGTVATTFTYYVVDDGDTANGGINADPDFNVATITNQGVNNPPVVSGTNAVTVTEDTPYQFSITDFVFSDPENHYLQAVELVTLPSNGLLTLDGITINNPGVIHAPDIDNKLLVYTPDINITGTPADSFEFRVQDNGGIENGGIDTALSSQPMAIIINNISDTPSASNFDIDVVEDRVHTFSIVEFGFTDIAENDDFKSLHLKTLPVAGQLTLMGSLLTGPTTISKNDILNGEFTYQPPSESFSTTPDNFSFKVQDTGSDGLNTSYLVYTATINNINVNDPPTNSGLSLTTILEDSSYQFTASDFPYTDNENHELLNVIIDSLPVRGVISVAGVPVNTGDSISITDLNSGAITYQANSNATGTDQFFYRPQDIGGTLLGGVDTALISQAFMIEIAAVNDSPHGADFSINVTEDTIHTFNTGQFGFHDPAESHALENIILLTLPGNGEIQLNSVPLAAPATISKQEIDNGLLIYIPPEHTQGNVDTAFKFTVQDSGGVADGGNNTAADVYTALITNLGVNDPSISDSTTINGLEDITYAFKTDDFKFTDPENHQLKNIIIDSLPVDGTLLHMGQMVTAGLSISAADLENQQLTFLPEPDGQSSVTNSFYYRIQDNGGTLNGGYDTSLSSVLMLIEMQSVNDAPVGSPHTITTLEDTRYQFTLSDFPFSDIENNPLTEILLSTDSSGRLEVNGDVISAGRIITAAEINNGDFHYRPPENLNGLSADSFQVVHRDAGGTINGGQNTSIDPVLVEIDITPVNDPPQGRDAVVTVIEDTPVTIDPTQSGFSDIDNNDIQAVHITALPQAGLLMLSGSPLTVPATVNMADINAGNLVFRPATNSYGDNYSQLHFQLIDDDISLINNIDPTPNTITFSVTNVNDAPEARSSVIEITEDNHHIFEPRDFPLSDHSDSPFENSLAGIRIESLPAQGSLSLDNSPVSVSETILIQDINAGLLRFSPAPNANGPHYTSFMFYVIDDGPGDHNGQSISIEAAEISFSVIAENDSPQANPDSFTTTESKVFNSKDSEFSVTDNDTDYDTEDELSVSLLSPPKHGQLQLNADGTFIYAHDDSETIFDEFSYELSDGTTTDKATVQISILPFNDPPIAEELDTYSTGKDESFQLQLPESLFKDPDVHDTLVITLHTIDGSELPDWISFDQSTMQISGIPDRAGDFFFKLTATDTNSTSIHADLFFTVTEKPKAAAAKAGSTDEPFAFQLPAQTIIGESSAGIAIVEPTSLASANQTATRQTPIVTDNPEELHTEIHIPPPQISEVIAVFSPATNTKAESPPASDHKNLEVIKLAPVKQVLPLTELFKINENQFTTSMSQQLDLSSESMAHGTEFNLKITGAAISVSAGFSIGYIVWLLRGGLLLSTVLTSLPAWRWVDPLPVLETMSNDTDSSNDESLEDMVTDEDNTVPQIEDQKSDTPVDVYKKG